MFTSSASLHFQHTDPTVSLNQYNDLFTYREPVVSLVFRMAGSGPQGPEFEPLLVIELIPGVVDSACHPSEVGEMSTIALG